jgi:hypothetical protein
MKGLIALVAVACAAVVATNLGYAAPAAPPRQDKANLRDEITATANDPGTRKPDRDRLLDAAKKLDESLNDNWWIPADQYRLDFKDGGKVFDKEKDAEHKLLEIQNDPKSTVDDALLQSWIDEIVRIDQELARQARRDALSNPGGYDAKKYDESTIEFGKSLQAYDPDNPVLSEGKPEEAIDHLKKSWQKAIESYKKFT